MSNLPGNKLHEGLDKVQMSKEKNQSGADVEILSSHPWLRQEWGTLQLEWVSVWNYSSVKV